MLHVQKHDMLKILILYITLKLPGIVTGKSKLQVEVHVTTQTSV